MLPSLCPYLGISRSIRRLGSMQGRLHMLLSQPLANGRQTHSAVHDFNRSTVNPFVIYSLQPLYSNPCRVATICTNNCRHMLHTARDVSSLNTPFDALPYFFTTRYLVYASSPPYGKKARIPETNEEKHCLPVQAF
jgi:hypothetical protein